MPLFAFAGMVGRYIKLSVDRRSRNKTQLLSSSRELRTRYADSDGKARWNRMRCCYRQSWGTLTCIIYVFTWFSNLVAACRPVFWAWRMFSFCHIRAATASSLIPSSGQLPPTPDEQAFEAIKVSIDAMLDGVKVFLNSGMNPFLVLCARVRSAHSHVCIRPILRAWSRPWKSRAPLALLREIPWI